MSDLSIGWPHDHGPTNARAIVKRQETIVTMSKTVFNTFLVEVCGLEGVVKVSKGE